MNRLKIIYSSVVLLLVPVLAQAQGLVAPPKPTNLPGTSADRASSVLLVYINLGLAIVGIIAVGFLIYGGFRYITSAGNDEVAEGAKKTIQNAIIGLVIIILSYTIITVIINAIGRGQV